MLPFPLISLSPLLTTFMPGLLLKMSSLLSCRAAAIEQWILRASLDDSMRDAVLTVSPKRQYRGLRLPTMFATTGPEWNPTRICTVPLVKSSESIGICAAAWTASSAKRAILCAWLAWFLTRFVTPIHASPIVSTLNTSCPEARLSNEVYSLSSMSAIFWGGSSALIFVKPTMSEKKMVTESLYSGLTFWPDRSCSTMCGGKTSKRTLDPTRPCCLSLLSDAM
mmetsp:Transcript_2399/g.5732  ORF Transcript_2399/g.5732 Transcript_2399/m.5732 type:complete len:223 (-) Transcript_2399:842-1510(-)